MSRSKSSQRWLKEHFSDRFVKQSKEEGYRSRAVYKLMEIQKRDAVIKPGMTVIDLGAAPGSWSQLISDWIGEKGQVIALDILLMPPLPRVDFIQGDFREASVFDALLKAAHKQKIDVIVSDIAPNTSGVPSVDQPRAIFLAELSVLLAQKILKPGGTLVVKVFQGEGYEDFLKLLRTSYHTVNVRKPDASRDRSREYYLVAKGFMI
jgi:23S rRNA (uridine2552-2'-O)-methyltransferase